jgi:hypothetical protein
MPGRLLQNHYCAAALQHRTSYKHSMKRPANRSSTEPGAPAHSRTRRRRASAPFSRAAFVILTLFVTGTVAAACGSESLSASQDSTAGGIDNLENSLLAYTDCMRTHGEPDMPEPTASDSGGHVNVNISATAGDGFDPRSPQFTVANNACRHLLHKGGSIPQGTTLTPADQSTYLRAAACMRSHGIPDFPDPTFQENGVTFNSKTPIDTTSPQFTTALATCEKLIPAGLPYSSSNGRS